MVSLSSICKVSLIPFLLKINWCLDLIVRAIIIKANALGSNVIVKCFGDLAMKILMDEPDEVSGRFATIAWSLWHERNKFRLTPYSSLPDDTHPRAVALWLEFLAENTPIETHKSPSPTTPWSPPPFGLYKVNFDGAVFQDSHEAGLGVIIRDPNGLIIASLVQKIPFPGSVVMVEALAARRADFCD